MPLVPPVVLMPLVLMPPVVLIPLVLLAISPELLAIIPLELPLDDVVVMAPVLPELELDVELLLPAGISGARLPPHAAPTKSDVATSKADTATGLAIMV
jgi:hypothetical protein